MKQGSGTLNITSQGGSAPDLALEFEVDNSPFTLPDSWQSRFGGWHATVEYLVSQNKAVDRLGGWASHMESLIEIPIDPRDAVPVRVLGKVDCEMIDGLLQQNDGDLIAFLIPRVPFNFLGEVVTDRE